MQCGAHRCVEKRADKTTADSADGVVGGLVGRTGEHSLAGLNTHQVELHQLLDRRQGGPSRQAIVRDGKHAVGTQPSTPAITSPAADTETFGVPFGFTVTTNGYPAPKLTKSGALPAGVAFTDNGDGSATIAGTPTNGAVGVYTITLTANASFDDAYTTCPSVSSAIAAARSSSPSRNAFTNSA